MDRLEGIIQQIAEAKRQELLDRCANGGDDDLAPEDRPDRAEISPGCLLKPFDDVLVSGHSVRVLCPGRGVGWFYALQYVEPSFFAGQFEPQYVEDRAPADPNETPMPIFPEAPPPE